MLKFRRGRQLTSCSFTSLYGTSYIVFIMCFHARAWVAGCVPGNQEGKYWTRLKNVSAISGTSQRNDGRAGIKSTELLPGMAQLLMQYPASSMILMYGSSFVAISWPCTIRRIIAVENLRSVTSIFFQVQTYTSRNVPAQMFFEPLGCILQVLYQVLGLEYLMTLIRQADIGM